MSQSLRIHSYTAEIYSEGTAKWYDYGNFPTIEQAHLAMQDLFEPPYIIRITPSLKAPTHTRHLEGIKEINEEVHVLQG